MGHKNKHKKNKNDSMDIDDSEFVNKTNKSTQDKTAPSGFIGSIVDFENTFTSSIKNLTPNFFANTDPKPPKDPKAPKFPLVDNAIDSVDSAIDSVEKGFDEAVDVVETGLEIGVIVLIGLGIFIVYELFSHKDQIESGVKTAAKAAVLL